MMKRRHFIYTSMAAAAATACGKKETVAAPGATTEPEQPKKPEGPLFEISLAQWSLHRMLRSGKLNNLDFPKFAKDKFGITAVEYVNLFFKHKAKDMKYLAELKKRSVGEGVQNLMIMCDGEGQIGAKTEQQRIQTVENHKKWVEAAKFLGCHTIRVNGHGHGTPEEAAKRVVDGLSKLSEFAKQHEINVVVENHGGNSSDGKWLSGVLKSVGMDNCGSLPDFGNFHHYDRYQGIEDLMPFAKGVSAKSRVFNEEGIEQQTDFYKAMDIVLKSGFRGHVGIEFEGGGSEEKGIQLTKALLEKVRDEYKPA